jgi:hypothetical protein
LKGKPLDKSEIQRRKYQIKEKYPQNVAKLNFSNIAETKVHETASLDLLKHSIQFRTNKDSRLRVVVGNPFFDEDGDKCFWNYTWTETGNPYNALYKDKFKTMEEYLSTMIVYKESNPLLENF